MSSNEFNRMPRIVFTSNLQRYIAVPERTVAGVTVGQALGVVFDDTPQIRDYVLDEQGHVRRHVHIYVDGHRIADRERLSDAVRDDSEICVLQALSGG
jgi:molybdopterin converting factor small subunit